MHLYFFLCLLGHVPLLFSKIAFVDNHEIYSSILYYNNFFEFIKNHNEINPFLGEPSRFRPFYYIIKGNRQEIIYKFLKCKRKRRNLTALTYTKC
jgi:hypothetical protein